MTEKTEELLKVKEVCALLRIHRTYFWKLRKKGLYPPAIKNPLRWKRADFDSPAQEIRSS